MTPVARYLTTTEAAAYCGFKTTGAVRKGKLDGKVQPVGLRYLRSIMGEAVAEFDLERNPMELIKPLDTSTWRCGRRGRCWCGGRTRSGQR